MEKDLKQADDMHSIPMTSISSGKGRQVNDDVYYYTDQIVNIIFVGPPGGRWFLVDAGMPNSAQTIIEEAEKRFGKDRKPEAILLTHGHFDHVGSLVDLLEAWHDVPVYAHPLEFPFLTGKQDYPEPDVTVEGGMLAKISMVYPHKAIDIASRLREFPIDGVVPGFADWTWIHTPGHTPGHISFFRRSDRTLLAGDAFVTVRQDSFYKVLMQKEEVNGPPRYLTTDWDAARRSVQSLAALRPDTAICGHGTYMTGKELTAGLKALSEEFDRLAKPNFGRYVDNNDGS